MLRLAAADSTVRVAKESHPFRSASLIEECNKSSSLTFDELFEGTNGKPNYLLGSPSMVDTTPLMLPWRTLPYFLNLISSTNPGPATQVLGLFGMLFLSSKKYNMTTAFLSFLVPLGSR